MALSGSRDFTLTRTQVIDAALRVIGVLRSGDTVTNDSNLETDCSQALNILLKSWHNLGVPLWNRKEVVVPLIATKRNYTVNFPGGDVNITAPIRIVDAFRRAVTGNTDTEVTIIDRDEYDLLSSKTSNGITTQIFYDYQDVPVGTQSNVFVWPIASTNSVTNLHLIYHKPYDDMDSATDNLDFPQAWFSAVKWNLAVALAPEFGRTVSKDVEKQAASSLHLAMLGDHEEGSIRFKPETRYA
jgi:hypothetical protein